MLVHCGTEFTDARWTSSIPHEHFCTIFSLDNMEWHDKLVSQRAARHDQTVSTKCRESHKFHSGQGESKAFQVEEDYICMCFDTVCMRRYSLTFFNKYKKAKDL
jgi:hypothetical protein